MNLSEANNTFTSDVLAFYQGVTALFTCNLVVGLPPNAYVVRLISGEAVGAMASELFALNLSISEILFCALSLYLILHFLLRMSIDVGILVLECTLQFMFISRPIFQSCICLERYLAVVHPTVFLRFKPLRYRLACCVVNWLLMLLYCTMPVFTPSATYSVYLLIALSMFFLVFMLYCGIHVLRVLKQPGPGEGNRDHKSRKGMKRNAFKVIMITLVFTSTTQFFRLFFLGPTLLYASEQFTLQAVLVSLSISIMTGIITPLLYFHRAGKLPCIKF